MRDDDWFHERDSSPIGIKYQARCHIDAGYESDLTIGRTYTITIEPRILPMSPLCSFTGDRGGNCMAHLYRFQRMKEDDHVESLS